MGANNPKDRSITLTVQANKLFNSNVTNQDIDNYTALTDDSGFGNAFGQPNKDFETLVYMNKKICWSIKLDSPNGDDKDYSVSLSKIVHKPVDGNPNFFTKDELNVDPDTGKVCGKISQNPNLPNKDDSYNIEFSVGFSRRTPNGGEQSGIMLVTLDPKLKISVRP